MRDKLYKVFMRKNIGWFDLRDNAPGVLTNVLASEAQTVNGASTEGLAVIMESTFAICTGVVIGFVYSWRLSLVALACVPFMMLGGVVNAKMTKGMNNIDE